MQYSHVWWSLDQPSSCRQEPTCSRYHSFLSKTCPRFTHPMPQKQMKCYLAVWVVAFCLVDWRTGRLLSWMCDSIKSDYLLLTTIVILLFLTFSTCKIFPIPCHIRCYVFIPHFNLPTKLYSLITSMKHILIQNDVEEMHEICYYSIFCKYSLKTILYLFFPLSMWFFLFRILDDYNDYLRLRPTFSIHL